MRRDPENAEELAQLLIKRNYKLKPHSKAQSGPLAAYINISN
jgi:hypothetical protein